MTDKTRKRFPDLPPCKVCGDKASGLHYGVNSCEACKVFFYRNIKRLEKLTCDAGNKCQLDPDSGIMFTACRMNKCLALGMTLKGKKRGRYSFERRAGLMLQWQKQSPWNGPQNVGPVTSQQKQIERRIQIQDVSPPRVTGTEQTRGCSEAKKSVQLTHEEIQRIVDKLRDLYDRHSQYPPEYYDKVKEVQRLYLETETEKRRIFGRMSPLPTDEFLEIYHKTGMDIDGRVCFVKQCYQVLEDSCLKYVHYAQELPGFDNFCKEDQIAILKGAKSSFWLLADYPSLDIENGLVTGHTYVTVKREEFLSEIYADGLFDIGAKLQKCELTFDEVNVMRALVLFNQALCITPEGKDHAKEQTSTLLQVLQHLCNKNHKNPDAVDKLLAVKQEMLDFDHNATTQWRVYFSLYNGLVRRDEKGKPLPLLQVLYELPK